MVWERRKRIRTTRPASIGRTREQIKREMRDCKERPIRRFWPNHANQTMRGKVTSLIINQAIESKRMEVEEKKRRKEKTQRHRGTELKLRVERQKP